MNDELDYIGHMAKQCHTLAVELATKMLEMKADPEPIMDSLMDSLMATIVGLSTMMNKEDFLLGRLEAFKESINISKRIKNK